MVNRSPRRFSSVRHKLLLLLYFSIILGAFIFFAYHVIYARKVVAGVSLGALNFSGLSRSDVTNRLLLEFRATEGKPFILELTDESHASPGDTFRYRFLPSDFDFSYEATKSAEKVYRFARSGNLFKDLNDELRAIFFGINLSPDYAYDRDKFNNLIRRYLSDVLRPSAEAAFRWEKDKIEITPPQVGYAVDESLITGELTRALINFERVLTVPIVITLPDFTVPEVESLRGEVEKMMKINRKLKYGEKEWPLSSPTILSFLKVESGPRRQPTLNIDREAIGGYLKTLAQEINRPTRLTVLEVKDKKATRFVPPETGIELDIFTATNLISQSLWTADLSAVVSLPVIKLTARGVDSSGYGIRDLLAEGLTDFSGSIPGRIHNIKLAAGRLNGLLVAPGELFSFNEKIGEISAKTGYDQAYVIEKGRTVLGEGGGVCQVSTTLFRAVLYAGLPVTKRTAHDYRVHYYEPPVGLDATVYSPAVDLQFRNDTANYFLIQTEADGVKLKIRLYGTSDGRTVEMGEPIVSRETAPPETLYQEDPTLTRGVTKQIDWSAWGADVSVSRVVRRNGEVLEQDVFQSHYKPWRAIFLIGTKE